MSSTATRIFVTGSSGFVGSHLLAQLLAESRRYQAAILRRPGSNPWRIAPLLKHVETIVGDLTEPTSIDQQLRKFAPQVVVHLGWQGVTGRRYDDTTQLDNINNSINLLRMSAAAGASVWIGLGSQAEYGPCHGTIAEDTPCHAMTLYGAAKLSVCQVARHFCAVHDMRFAWLRLFSCYGPGDHADRMIPNLITNLLAGRCPPLTAGEQRWDYMHVEDAAAAIRNVIFQSIAEGVFNLGSGATRTIRKICEYIRDLINPSLPLVFGEVPYQTNQVMHLQADIRRLAEVTEWAPQIPLDEGLRQTVQWYRDKGALFAA
ncbi:MAG: NAD(P)-dependent oxidoreductase [Pirellulaceae bacterium]|nr:NAD(P)-dependent oxidoreductase [Pirellulaceae bacterium]